MEYRYRVYPRLLKLDDKNIELTNYMMIRKDRATSRRNNKIKGGGLATFIIKDIYLIDSNLKTVATEYTTTETSTIKIVLKEKSRIRITSISHQFEQFLKAKEKPKRINPKALPTGKMDVIANDFNAHAKHETKILKKII